MGVNNIAAVGANNSTGERFQAWAKNNSAKKGELFNSFLDKIAKIPDVDVTPDEQDIADGKLKASKEETETANKKVKEYKQARETSKNIREQHIKELNKLPEFSLADSGYEDDKTAYKKNLTDLSQHFFDRINANNDESISYEEYENYGTQPTDGKYSQEFLVREYSDILKTEFKTMDTNNNGELSRKELDCVFADMDDEGGKGKMDGKINYVKGYSKSIFYSYHDWDKDELAAKKAHLTELNSLLSNPKSP